VICNLLEATSSIAANGGGLVVGANKGGSTAGTAGTVGSISDTGSAVGLLSVRSSGAGNVSVALDADIAAASIDPAHVIAQEKWINNADASKVVRQTLGNADQLINIGLNGQSTRIGTLTEETTILAAAETDTAIQIPAGALVLAVSVRVTTVIPDAATFDVGVAGALNRYADDLAVAAGTTSPGTMDGVRYYAAAASIRITPNTSPLAATGKVRVTIHYILVTPPTS